MPVQLLPFDTRSACPPPRIGSVVDPLIVSDAFGELDAEIRAPDDGIVIGRSANPVVRRGDALINLATAFEGPPVGD